MDPAKRQYLIFAVVIAIILSGIINFMFVDLVKGSILYGFPINLANTSGIGMFLARLVDSIVMGLFLTPLLYYGINWYLRRA